MNTITPNVASVATAAMAAPATPAADPLASGGDLLAAMNPAMDAAFAVGRPHDMRGAAAILGTTGAYVNGANATIARIDEGLELRRTQLEQLRMTDPDAARRMAQQIDMLERLRDRIRLSIERVTETLAGTTDESYLDDHCGFGVGDRSELRSGPSVELEPEPAQVAAAYRSGLEIAPQ